MKRSFLEHDSSVQRFEIFIFIKSAESWKETWIISRAMIRGGENKNQGGGWCFARN